MSKKRIYEFTSEKTTINDADYGQLDRSGYPTAKKFTMLNLWNYIKTKADTFYQTFLVSGANIKTINGESVLGSGNLEVGGANENIATNDLVFTANSTTDFDGYKATFDNAELKIIADANSSGDIPFEVVNTFDIPIIRYRGDNKSYRGNAGNVTYDYHESPASMIVFGTTSEVDTANIFIKKANTGHANYFFYAVTASNFKMIGINNNGRTSFGGEQNYASPYDATVEILGGGTNTDRLFSVKNNLVNDDFFLVRGDGQIQMKSLPTSDSGLAVGTLWNDGGTLKIKL
jgi:hypothetical protein